MTLLPSVRDLTRSYGHRPLFSGLDLTLWQGSQLGLLGPNGSGKSTPLPVLGGEVGPDAGTVTPGGVLRIVLFERGRAALDPGATLRRALCPKGDTVTIASRSMWWPAPSSPSSAPSSWKCQSAACPAASRRGCAWPS
jgi:ATP-binding cassette subfamily F protein uup